MGKSPSLVAKSDLDTLEARTYIVWENGKEYGLVQSHVLSMETYAHKTLKSCLKGHLAQNNVKSLAKAFMLIKNIYKPINITTLDQYHHKVK